MAGRKRVNKTSVTDDLSKRFNTGFIAYCRRLWPFDYGLLSALQIVGYRSAGKEVATELQSLKVQEYVVEDPEKDKDIVEYNCLATSLTDCGTSVTSLEELPWKNVEAQVLDYLDTGLEILEDSDKYGRRRGYYYNQQSGSLRFYDGANFSNVCTFDSKGKEAMDFLFPELVPSKSWFSSSSQKRVRLTSEKFLDLIRVAQVGAINPPKFHVPISTSFVKAFDKVRGYMKLKKLWSKEKDFRSEKKLVEDIIADIKGRVKEYTDNRSKYSENDVAIMEAVRDYLDTGDDSKLAEKIAEYDKSWVKWSPFPSQAYRVLSYIGKIQKNTLFDKMLQVRAEQNKVNSARGDIESNELAELAYDPFMDRDEARQRVSEFWDKQNVDLDSYIAMLGTLDQKLAELLETYPEEEDDDADLIGKMRLQISQRLTAANNPTSVDPREPCQLKCAAITNYLLDVLSNRYAFEEGMELIEITEQSKYNEVGDVLFEVLNTAQMHVQAGPYQRVDPLEVVQRVEKLKLEAGAIQIRVREFQRELTVLQQTPFTDDIKEFLEDVLNPRIDELTSLEAEIAGIRIEPFNLLIDNKTPDQQKVFQVVDSLENYGTELTDALESVMTKMNDPRWVPPSSEGNSSAPKPQPNKVDRCPYIPFRPETRDKPKVAKQIDTLLSRYGVVQGKINVFLEEVRQGVIADEAQQEAANKVATGRSPGYLGVFAKGKRSESSGSLTSHESQDSDVQDPNAAAGQEHTTGKANTRK